MSHTYSRPRRGQAPRGRPRTSPPEPRAPGADIKAGLGSLVHFLDVPEAKAITDPGDVAIKNVRPVVSYNWKDAGSPTIIVPGSPLIWSDRRFPYTVQPDSGIAYIDQNAAHCLPSINPLEPLFLALNTMEPEFDMAAVDLVTDRNNLRKLLRWVTDDNDRDFRIDAQLLGEETVILTRWEEHNTEDSTGFRGFGHSFEREATKVPPGCRGTTGHHRIIQYTLGDLRVLCRSVVDAYDPALAGDAAPDGVDDLLEGLSGITLASSAPTPKTPESTSEINIVRAGKLVPQASIMELKSRSTRAVIDWKGVWPQVFFSATPTTVLGRHERGKFVSVERKSLEEMDSAYAEEAEAGFGKLIQALREIRAVVLSRGKGPGVAFVFMKDGRGSIEVYEKESEHPGVSPELLARYEELDD
ncbi:hypothetical protein BOTBODRAFT_181611 [Botryobasidium botryosum FD-172 SS1]|uniref:Geranylgeranyl pyrophosphate synthetase n=1 Tax=Botryobasidium botryosum (strain FD-172 SS1) TaxID=930990 RepID=A0A067M4C2_BOTB1|nr:hypothetical protein BOTBODRAFT_181611 [Botryobasidium botryosum FD-172 SS1]